jgi:hypothetical protein
MLVPALTAARAISTIGLLGVLVSCGAESLAPATPASAGATAAPFTFPPSPLPVAPPLAVVQVSEAPRESTAAPVAEQPLDPTAGAATSYRGWMEEARLLHPYAEPVEAMWAVMLCESSGNAGIVAGAYHGLFQFSPETWGGAWNPYRDQPILDPRAQIFAAAKAWQDGNQSWWGCY